MFSVNIGLHFFFLIRMVQFLLLLINVIIQIKAGHYILLSCSVCFSVVLRQDEICNVFFFQLWRSDMKGPREVTVRDVLVHPKCINGVALNTWLS